MALSLARTGVHVIVTAPRERGEIDEVARESRNILPLPADVSREEDCSRVVAEAMARFGRLDVLVPALLWLASDRSDGVTGMRLDASRWREDLPESEAEAAARENAGWPGR